MGQARGPVDRTTGFEPATLTLARCWEPRLSALGAGDNPRLLAGTGTRPRQPARRHRPLPGRPRACWL